jgi:penicillin-binding protein 1C
MTKGTGRIVALIILLTGVTLYYFSLPTQLFADPYSTVLEDRTGELLSAAIAADGQWRFPESKVIPQKFKDALMLYEDKRFNQHFGVDLLALGRAFIQNFRAGKIVSGGSTISMQVIRLSRKGRSRTFYEKIVEAILATRLEFRYSKEEIFSMYASHAPYGGNVVGIDAACWRFFGRSANDINWSEAALLAILPNNPSLLHPGRNQQILKAKRDAFLERLMRAGKLDSLAMQLAMDEPIPESPQRLPRFARHLLAKLVKDGRGQTEVASSISLPMQMRVEQIVNDHADRLKANQIYNVAAIVANIKTGEVLAYVGNTNSGKAYQDDVDVISAPRSTGSILKPFLFAAMLEEGMMTQKTLLEDVPTNIQGFAPRNFSHQFDGAVPADQALIRSLNVPFVHALKRYRYEKFHDLLKRLGFTSFTQSPDHYGLTLILGGGEATLWEITGAYASMARTLNNYFDAPGSNKYSTADIHPLRYTTTLEELPGSKDHSSVLSASSIWLTFQALKEAYRPGEETGWRFFESSKKIAWKTGTSLGFRDAWAVGVNPEFAVGVWAGNADGEGRPGLVGTEAAAPILFDIFSSLPGQSWFTQPVTEMEQVDLCAKSGQRASGICTEVHSIWITKAGLSSPACQFHHLVHLSKDETHRVNSACFPMSEIKSVSWFVLPPVQEYYFRAKNLLYRPLPPFGRDCVDPSVTASMDVIYPRPNAKIFVPRELDGKKGNTIFEVAHSNATATVYWHLDGNYIGATRKSHHLALAPSEGNHVLTLVDEFGESIQRSFAVISD